MSECMLVTSDTLALPSFLTVDLDKNKTNSPGEEQIDSAEGGARSLLLPVRTSTIAGQGRTRECAEELGEWCICTTASSSEFCTRMVAIFRIKFSISSLREAANALI